MKKKARAERGQGLMTGTMGLEDPPPITEDDINKGMISLLNKGIIPKDVDLTPAFKKELHQSHARASGFIRRKKSIRNVMFKLAGHRRIA